MDQHLEAQANFSRQKKKSGLVSRQNRQPMQTRKKNERKKTDYILSNTLYLMRAKTLERRCALLMSKVASIHRNRCASDETALI